MTSEPDDESEARKRSPFTTDPGGVILSPRVARGLGDTGDTGAAGATAVRVEASIARRAADGTVDVSLAVTGITAEELEALWRNHIEPIVKRLQGTDAAAPRR
jgi:hypothetical protein